MNEGQLVPDEVVIGLVEERLRQAGREGRLHPRRLPAHHAAGGGARRACWRSSAAPSSRSIDVQVPEATLVERLGGRLSCPKDGASYHVKFTPPKKAGVCDTCGTALDHARRRPARGDRAAPARVPRQDRAAGRLLPQGGRAQEHRRCRRARSRPRPPRARARRLSSADVDQDLSQEQGRSRKAARGQPASSPRCSTPCEAACKPGASTWDLNEIADAKLKELGATSAFLGYHGYPAVLCTSVNEVVVHGIPRKDVVLKEGDIIGIDFGCFKDGFCGDSARTIADRQGDRRGEEADGGDQGVARPRDRAVQAGQSAAGHRLGGAVARRAARATRWCARSSGTASGSAMHEDPPVPNYGTPGQRAAA